MVGTPTPAFRASADKAIRAALGKPWKELARGPHEFDCWGFVTWVLEAGGVPMDSIPHLVQGGRSASLEAGKQAAVRSGWVRVPDKTPYSVAVLGKRGVFVHVAIYHPTGVFYHAFERHGVCGHRESFLRGAFDNFEYGGPKWLG